MESWILQVSFAKLKLKPECEAQRASLTLQESQSIHDSLNIEKIGFIS